MAVGGPSGSNYQIFIDILFRTHQEGLRQAGEAVRQAGVRPLEELQRATQTAAAAQEKLQQAYARAMQGIANWEATVGRSTQTLRAAVAVTERYLRLGLHLTEEQRRAFAIDRASLAMQQDLTERLRQRTRETERLARVQERFTRELEAVGRLRAVGIDPRRADVLEARALQRGIVAGIASEEQIARFRELQTVLRAVGTQITLLGQAIDVGRVIAWGMAWTAAYRALNLVTAAVGALTIGAVQRIAEFQQRTLRLAAELVNLDPALPFREAMRHARALAVAMEDLQPGFIGTTEQLQEIFAATVRFFGVVDLGARQVREDFLTVANAVIAAQIGINRAGSAFREIAALIEGVQRPGAQLLEMLARLDPEIVRNIRRWRELGGAELVLRNLAQLLAGQRGLVMEVSNTLQGQLNIIERNLMRIQRRLGEAAAGGMMVTLRGVAFLTGVGGGVPQAELVQLLGGALIQAAVVAAYRRIGGLAGGAFLAGVAALGGRIVAALGGIPGLVVLGIITAVQLLTNWFRRLEQEGTRVSRQIQQGLARTAQGMDLVVRGFMAEQARSAQAVLVRTEEAFRVGAATFEDLVRARRAVLEAERGELRNLLELRDVVRGAERESLQRQAEAKALEIIRGEVALQREMRLREEALAQLQRFVAVERTLTELETDIRREESLARRVTLLEAVLALRRQELAEELARRLPDDPERRLAHERQLLQLRRAIAEVEHEIVRARREQQEALRRSRAAEFRALQMPFLAEVVELGIREQEAWRQAAGDRERMLQLDREFWATRVAIVRAAAEALRRAVAEAAQTVSAALIEPAELRAEASRAFADFLRGMEGPEGIEAITRRFDRVFMQLRASFDVVRVALQQALDDIRQRFAGMPSTAEQLRHEAELRIRLARLTMEQVRAEEALTRERQRAIRQDALAVDIRLLEQRLQLLSRFVGDPRFGVRPEDLERVTRALERARRLQELRDLGRLPGALEERLGMLLRVLQAPGVSPEEVQAIQEEIADIRRVMAEVAEEAQRAGAATDAMRRASEDLVRAAGDLAAAQRMVADEATRAASRALADYEAVFGAIRTRLDQMVEWWRRAGEASGRAFRDAILEQLRGLPVPPALERQRSALPVTPVAGTVIQIGRLDITDRMDPLTVERFVRAVLGAAGDRAVQQDRRWIGDNVVV